MIRVFTWHRVTNYAAWRKHYDAFWRQGGLKGSIRSVVYQDVTSPNLVTVCDDFQTLAQALAFARSKRLHKAMRMAGVREPVAAWMGSPTRPGPKPAKRRRKSRRKSRRRRR